MTGFKEVHNNVYLDFLSSIGAYTIKKEQKVVSVVTKSGTVCMRLIAPAGKDDKYFIKENLL